MTSAAAFQQPAGIVRVTIQAAGTLEPLPGAEIYLMETATGRPSPASSGATIATGTVSGVFSVSQPGASFNAITDASGTAVFSNLAPGRYTVTARRDGYAGVPPVNAPGVMPPPASFASIALDTPQPTQEISLFLAPAASVSGRIRDVKGGPIANARVLLTVLGYRDGRRTLLPGPTAITDQRGEYRLASVAPGEYYVRVEQSPVGGTEAYYPGSGDFQQATSISVKSGEEVVGIDFEMPRIERFRVSGTVINAPVRIPLFSYAPRDDVRPELVIATIPNSRAGPNGEFEVSLPVGSWDLFPMVSAMPSVPAGTPSSPRYSTARLRVDVVDRDIGGLTVVVGSADVKGRIIVADTPQTVRPFIPPVGVSLVPRDSTPTILTAQLRAMQAGDANGSFAFSTVPPGEYSLQLFSIPAGLHVSDIRVGSTSVFNDGIIAAGIQPVEPIEVSLSRGGGTVEVALQGLAPDTPAEERVGMRIVLIPTPVRRQNLLLYKSSLLLRGDSLTMQDITPGEYKIFAWKNLPPGGAEFNAEFVAQYEDLGIPVTVIANQTSRVQVKLIQ
jgi:hypothetical protein